MRVLVIGGTGFLGGAITQAALNDGYDVDVLSRRQLKSVHPRLTYLIGDRYSSLPLLDKTYDFVFDTCAFEPEAIQVLLDNLELEQLSRYVFISSASVYEDYSFPRISEKEDLHGASSKDLELAQSLSVSERTSALSYGYSYGPLKRECEILLEKELGDKTTILRCGLLVGAGDYSDRLTWWVRRLDQSGEAICPKPKERNVQLIDVRDAANFAVKTAKDNKSGIFNLTGHHVTFEKLLNIIKDCTKSGVSLNWVSLKSFTNQNLAPWSDIPLVFPDIESLKYFFDIDTNKATEAGLVLRELEETILNLLEWDRERRDRTLKCGYSIETEQAIASDQNSHD